MSQIESIKQTLQFIKPSLLERYNVISLGLFGSVVREDFSPSKSDIDIIVDFSKPIGIEFIKAKYFKEIEPEIIYI